MLKIWDNKNYENWNKLSKLYQNKCQLWFNKRYTVKP